jgi:hypothetical protein
MRASWRLLVLIFSLAGAMQALALSEPAREDPQAALEQNRRLLKKWRADPEHYARLQQDWRAFQELPAERQESLRKLDRDLHAAEPAEQARLWRVLDRYVAWLDKLPEADRARIASAANAKERLKSVKEIRDRQWVSRLPKGQQDYVWKLKPEEQPREIARLRQADRVRRLEWFWSTHARDEAALKRARPTRIAEFPPEVQFYFWQTLNHLLRQQDRKRLQSAEGHWPLYAQTLAQLVAENPFTLPGMPNRGTDGVLWPRYYRQLPKALQDALPLNPVKALEPKQRKRLNSASGKWPEYAVEFTKIARERKVVLPRQLGPSRPEEFAPPVQKFIKDRLIANVFTKDEAAKLAAEEGKWPEYPKLLLQLTRSHRLVIPGMAVPANPEFWQAMKTALPDVPDRVLRDFALTELSAEERAELNLSLGDPSSRDRLTQTYFKRHPDQLERYLKPAKDKAGQ